MIYPEGIKGPAFKSSDLVEFIFNGSELTLPIPFIPKNDKSIDNISTIKDFKNISTDSWDTDGLDNPGYELVSQQWIFEDTKTLDNIAICHFNAGLIETTMDRRQSNSLLNNDKFKLCILDDLTSCFADDEEENMDNPHWPKIHNQFNYKPVTKPHLNWVQVEMCFVEGNLPSPLVYIPIDKRFILSISFSMTSLHYENRQNPYSDDLIRKLEFNLFDEYLQSIDLRYTEETLAIIRASAE